MIWGFLLGLACGAIPMVFWARAGLKSKLKNLRRAVNEIGHQKSISSQPNTALVSDILHDVIAIRNKSQQREKKLKKSGKRLSLVLNNMDVGVVVLDLNKNVIFSNHSARDLLNVSENDIKVRSLLEIVRNPEIDEAISQCCLRQADVETEFETIRGPERTLQVRVSQMPRKSKAQTMLVLVDVTNLRQLENMRRDFVANVSHELKTPLASIKAYSETLRRGAINDEANRMSFVQTIEDQANRLHQLIIDLIHLARIEQGKTAFVVAEVELTGLLLERIEAFRDAAEQAKIVIDYKLTDHELWVRADEEALQTILDNLLSNAIRYTPANGQISVVCQKNSKEAVFEVVDTGIGIASDQQERIFERFYRVDKARSREKGGTGLGLSIVKHLTQSMGGSVTVSSSIGIGSRFTVKIPLITEPDGNN